MSKETFTCENCGGVFNLETTDDEADAEAERLFGVKNAHSKVGSGDDDMAIICDDCWKSLGLDTL